LNINKTKTEKNKLKEHIKFFTEELIQKKESSNLLAKTSVDTKKNHEVFIKRKEEVNRELERLEFNPKMIESVQRQIKESEQDVI
jgi:hypothetical protein